jgi:uncharacterized lipoprotein YehR (DUF1307 family)
MKKWLSFFLMFLVLFMVACNETEQTNKFKVKFDSAGGGDYPEQLIVADGLLD